MASSAAGGRGARGRSRGRAPARSPDGWRSRSGSSSAGAGEGRGGARRARAPDVSLVRGAAACREACARLARLSEVGLDCEGVRLSRAGALELVLVAGAGEVVLFDVGPANAAAGALFDAGGLRALLENPRVTKVVHDCRHDADALLHQFDVRVGPVLDTQVAFTELRMLKGCARALPAGLRTVLKRFAALSNEEFELKGTVKKLMRDNPRYWSTRPISDQMRQYAAADVCNLVRAAAALRRAVDAQDKGAWERVVIGSELYADAFRNDPEGRGPEKALRYYDQLSRDIGIERMQVDLDREAMVCQKTDPLRKFKLDGDRIVAKMLAVSVNKAKEDVDWEEKSESEFEADGESMCRMDEEGNGRALAELTAKVQQEYFARSEKLFVEWMRL